MEITNILSEIWKDSDNPFLIYKDQKIHFSDLSKQKTSCLNQINQGNVVALIGDYNPITIKCLLKLIELKAIVLPLTNETKLQHPFFFDTALVDFVVENGNVTQIKHERRNEMIDNLKCRGHSGLIAFSSGTTGKAKAILYDLTKFMKKFFVKRQAYKSINFLLFDHVGGLNTMFHTLFNKGTIIVTSDRKVNSIIDCCIKHEVEVLPTTPTFLRLLLMSGYVPNRIPPHLKIVTYGTELMDALTLRQLCELLPNVDFRQTYGVSELGVLRVKSEARDSLFMKIGGEGVLTRVKNSILEIKTKGAMEGYLNAPSPFDEDGWYCTKDIVEEKEAFFRIIGRNSDVINVSGLKFMPSDVEKVALDFEGVLFVKVYGRNNPISGQHCEIIVQPKERGEFKLDKYKDFLARNLQAHMRPKRIKLGNINIGHRYKKT